jgi:ElaB/YqjD/DUF883 family membrane-anchored ribosome-binding protein
MSWRSIVGSNRLVDTMDENPIPDVDPSIPPSHDPFQAAKENAMKAAEELRSAATEKARELKSSAEAKAHDFKESAEKTAEDFGHYAEDAFKEARECCADFKTEAVKFTRENPVQALVGALGVGMILGLLLRK